VIDVVERMQKGLAEGVTPLYYDVFCLEGFDPAGTSVRRTIGKDRT
jgi:hypothetical protein